VLKVFLLISFPTNADGIRPTVEVISQPLYGGQTEYIGGREKMYKVAYLDHLIHTCWDTRESMTNTNWLE
jgi:hypothetical protein